MGKAAKREHLARILNSHAGSIHETFQVLDEPAAPSLEKVEWSEVTKLGDQISKQATITGMLCTGEAPDAQEFEENIGRYCNVLQGFLLLCHGTTVGAGPTLQAYIRSSVKQIIDCSLLLLKAAVSSYGLHGADRRTTIPRLSGSVWEACEALKKTPTTNFTAVGRSITQVAVSVKDVLREMRELKPAASDTEGGAPCTSRESHGDSESEGELGNDLTLEEMKIAYLAIDVVSDTLVTIKEVIRLLSDLIRKPVTGVTSQNHIQPLERLLKYYRETGNQIDELGACIYPPQEISLIKASAEKMLQITNGVRTELQNMECFSEGLTRTLEALEGSLVRLQIGLLSPPTGLIQEMQRLAV